MEAKKEGEGKGEGERNQVSGSVSKEERGEDKNMNTIMVTVTVMKVMKVTVMVTVIPPVQRPLSSTNRKGSGDTLSKRGLCSTGLMVTVMVDDYDIHLKAVQRGGRGSHQAGKPPSRMDTLSWPKILNINQARGDEKTPFPS